MPQPRNLGRVITRFSENKVYTVIDILNNTSFKITADIQQTRAPFWERMMGNVNVNAQITILVRINGKNRLLEGGNRYSVVFHGIEYIVNDVLDASRQGFMKYIAVAKIQG